MKDIFISYENRDSERALLFHHKLEAKGYDVWRYENDCFGGPDHQGQVEEEISNCSAFIFIMSENSIMSDEVTFELRTAYKENKPIFPIYFYHKWEDFLRIKTEWREILRSRTGINGEHNLENALDNLVLGLELENICPKIKYSDDRERIVPITITGSLDHFINRTKELESIKGYVADNDTRFLLVTGPGGYGKSALIEKLINEVTDNYCLNNTTFQHSIDSIVWVDLSVEENRSIDTVVNLLCKTFPENKSSDYKKAWNNESSLSNKLDFLFGRLLGRDRRLIIFDNFESILNDTNISEQFKDIEEFINIFLNVDHAAIIIATSRRSLTLSHKIEGKHGKRKKELILDYGLPLEEAVDLITSLDKDGLCDTDDPKKNILREVARKIDCVPRTIETLIGILKNYDRNLSEFYTEEEFEELIANPTKELIAGLQKEQKQIIEVLSVLDRPVMRDAVQSFFPDEKVSRQLISLKRCFAVKLNKNREYYLHSIIQKVVYDQISEDENLRQKLHKKAANWYASQHLEQDKWIGFDEVKSLVNEIQHRIQAGEFNRACEILNLIDREYLAVWNYYNLIIHLRTQMLDKLTNEGLNELNLGNLGCAYYEIGQTSEGVKYYNKTLEISRKTKNIAGESRWLGNLSIVKASEDTKQAEHMMEKAYKLALQVNDLLHMGRWQGKLAGFKLKAGKINVEEAILELENALKITRIESVQDKRFESIWLHVLYKLYNQLGDNVIAAEYLESAIEVKDSIGDYSSKAEYLVELYNIKSEHVDPLQVSDLLEKAFKLRLKVGQQEDAYNLAEHLAKFYLSQGLASKSLEKYIQILEFSREVGNHSRELHYLSQIGIAYFMKKDFKNSLSYFLAVNVRAAELNLSTKDYFADYNIADSYIQLLDLDNALKHFKLALDDEHYTNFLSHYNIALIYLSYKKSNEADEHFKRCFKSYNNLAENNLNSHQIEFIYAIILVLREKSNEAIMKLETIFKDKGIEIYAYKMALLDVRLAQKILPSFNDLNQLEEMLINKLKSLDTILE